MTDITRRKRACGSRRTVPILNPRSVRKERKRPMNPADSAALDGDSISYDAAPVAEVELDGVEYRVDAGLGSLVAISRREAGTSSWAPVAQARWDGVRLRAKSLGH